ncbi:HEPN domain-containing protein [Okeania sp. SIO2B3]|uniref:HEPN domain-containing protein n=1 Tax=Okeania sp. SIO2B3 TaxID=2607784 RepID=UPI003424897F
MYLNNKFLNLVQVVESYHRRRIETNEENNSSLQEREESYNCCLIKKNKKKEPYLRERLEALLKFELILDVTNELIQDKDSFLTKVVHTRNYLTHYRESLKEKAAKGKYLYCLTELLSFILQACFLTEELGLTSDKCYQLLNRNLRYQYTLDRVRKKNCFDCPKENL